VAGDIREWLEGLGLGKYAESFAENEVEFALLPELSGDDLRELGIPLGPRKVLLKAIAELSSEAAESEASAAGPGPQSQLEAERRQLTVMFVDLVGSTALSGRLDPEDLREVMRRYQDAVAGAVTRYAGHVAKYLGDGVLVYFGWPRAHEDQAERAVRAGLDAVAAVGALELGGEGKLGARAGIATGQVVIGDLVGEAGRDADAVSGETPNLAARLQEVGAAGQVAIDAVTRHLIGEAFDIEDLGARELKGFAAPISAWRVVGERALESRFEAAHAGHLTTLVGRQHEVNLLLDRWEQARAGEGQAVLLAGEAGIGKSRITQVLRARISEERHTDLRYQCSPHYQSTALPPTSPNWNAPRGSPRAMTRKRGSTSWRRICARRPTISPRRRLCSPPFSRSGPATAMRRSSWLRSSRCSAPRWLFSISLRDSPRDGRSSCCSRISTGPIRRPWSCWSKWSIASRSCRRSR